MDAFNPFNSKLMILTPKGRFVNLFGDFSPLCVVLQCYGRTADGLGFSLKTFFPIFSPSADL